jgi:hypothetical protein
MGNLSRFVRYERSSIGRAPVSKTGGWGFDSLRSCCREAVFGPPRSSMRAGDPVQCKVVPPVPFLLRVSVQSQTAVGADLSIDPRRPSMIAP